MDKLEEVTIEREKALDERDDAVESIKRLVCERDDLRYDIFKLKEKIQRFQSALIEIKDLPEETAGIDQYIHIATKALEPKEEKE